MVFAFSVHWQVHVTWGDEALLGVALLVDIELVLSVIQPNRAGKGTQRIFQLGR